MGKFYDSYIAFFAAILYKMKRSIQINLSNDSGELSMLTRKKALAFDRHILAYIGFGLLFLLALALRISLYPITTSDYTGFVSQWYDFIQTHGGFAALKYNFANYNPPYLYLIALTTYLPVPKIDALKSITVVFDGVLGIFTYLLISLKYKRSYAAIIGALVIVFAPTIFINSAAWGQCDAIYTAFCLGSLYFLLTDRPVWACIFFGLAISFKLQAIFFAPVLFVLLLKRKLPLQYLVLIPLVFALLLVPTLAAGRSIESVLSIYPGQISTGGVVQSGTFGGGTGRSNGGGFHGNGGGQFNNGGTGTTGTRPGNFNGTGRFNGGPGNFNGGGFSTSSLTLNAPSFYQWLPANAAGYWKWVGILLAGLFVLLLGILTLMSKQKLTAGMILKITLVFALWIPFLLPEMHERYFYLADVISIIYAFYFPRYFYIAIIEQVCSLLSYAPYLLHTQIIGLAYVAGAILLISLITLVDLVLTLYPGIRKNHAIPVISTDIRPLQEKGV